MILVRHGDSQHKVDGVTGGRRSCKGLTETGRQQAARLRDRFARDPSLAAPIHLYTSVVPRAIETAHILAEAFGADGAHQDCDLCSWHIPAECDGIPVREFQQRYAIPGGGVFRPFEAGNESWAELVGRVGRALWRIAQRHQGETTVVVAHTEVVNASLIVFGDLPLMLAFDGLVSNTSITEWITDDDTTVWPHARWTLVRFNDAAHLESP
jgi:broad specificity phosphatase PhoE